MGRAHGQEPVPSVLGAASAVLVDKPRRMDGGAAPAPRQGTGEDESDEGPIQVAVDRDFGTKVHETIVQLIAIATTAMYVMWTALITVNTSLSNAGPSPSAARVNGSWSSSEQASSWIIPVGG